MPALTPTERKHLTNKPKPMLSGQSRLEVLFDLIELDNLHDRGLIVFPGAQSRHRRRPIWERFRPIDAS
jgi:hypothetical protein